jgi:hypothetical protein
MPNEPLALAIKPPAAPSEDDFLALCAALSESARGRAFLAEYARRNRNADTEALLVAIGRIEARLRADASAVQRLRDDLRMLLIAIRLARPEIDAADPATQPAKLNRRKPRARILPWCRRPTSRNCRSPRRPARKRRRSCSCMISNKPARLACRR